MPVLSKLNSESSLLRALSLPPSQRLRDNGTRWSAIANINAADCANRESKPEEALRLAEAALAWLRGRKGVPIYDGYARLNAGEAPCTLVVCAAKSRGVARRASSGKSDRAHGFSRRGRPRNRVPCADSPTTHNEGDRPKT